MIHINGISPMQYPAHLKDTNPRIVHGNGSTSGLPFRSIAPLCDSCVIWLHPLSLGHVNLSNLGSECLLLSKSMVISWLIPLLTCKVEHIYLKVFEMSQTQNFASLVKKKKELLAVIVQSNYSGSGEQVMYPAQILWFYGSTVSHLSISKGQFVKGLLVWSYFVHMIQHRLI